MKRLAVVVVALVACKKTPAGSTANGDCDVIKKDPAHAMVELTKRYPNDALKVAQTIESCVAPTGDECDRVAAIVKAIPSMSGLAAPKSSSDYAAMCRSAPPAMRRCYLPSYVIQHNAECKKIISDMSAELAKPMELPTCDAGSIVVYLSEAGTWVATGKDPASRCFGARKGDSLDTAWLETELGQFKSKDCRPSVEVATEAGLKYQEIIAAMDVAVKVGLVDVELSAVDELPVSFKDATAAKSPQHCPATTIASTNAGAGSGATGHHQTSGRTMPNPSNGPDGLKQAKVIIVTRDKIMVSATGAGAGSAEDVMKLKDAENGAGSLKELAGALPPNAQGGDGTIILQADQDTPNSVVVRIITTAKASGYENVLFAVKNK